jgi:hypothetical protein
MVIEDIIKELRAELKRIDKLILALDSLNTVRRRGRPPKLLLELRAQAAKEEAAAASGRGKRSKKAATGKKRAVRQKRETG